MSRLILRFHTLAIEFEARRLLLETHIVRQNWKLNLKVSAFYLEKQKSFITEKNFF